MKEIRVLFNQPWREYRIDSPGATGNAVPDHPEAIAVITNNAGERCHAGVPANLPFGINIAGKSVAIGRFNTSNRTRPSSPR